MAIVVGIFIGCAMFIAMGFHLFADAKLFRIGLDGIRVRRELPAKQRRQADVMMATMVFGTSGYIAFLFIIAPFGRRDTIIWFLIVPFLILVPLGTIAAAVRGYRLGRRGRPPQQGE